MRSVTGAVSLAGRRHDAIVPGIEAAHSRADRDGLGPGGVCGAQYDAIG